MRERRGFTLIELTIVIAIIGIGATVAVTNFQLWQNHYSGVGFQREVLSKFNEARTRSMASSFQHRLRVDQGTGTVTLQRGNAGTASSTWTNLGQPIVGSRGAGIARIDNCSPSVPGPLFALHFNPNGEVLVRDITNNTGPFSLTEANIRISAASVTDRATIRVFGWTSKARLFNGW